MFNIIIWVPFLLGLADAVLPDHLNSCIFPINILKQNRGSAIVCRRLKVDYNGLVLILTKPFILFCFSNSKKWYAHRVVLWLNVGNGLVMFPASHKCIEPHCQNPNHLQNEKQEENSARERYPARQQRHCVLGCNCEEFCIPNIDSCFVSCYLHKKNCTKEISKVYKRRVLPKEDQEKPFGLFYKQNPKNLDINTTIYVFKCKYSILKPIFHANSLYCLLCSWVFT